MGKLLIYRSHDLPIKNTDRGQPSAESSGKMETSSAMNEICLKIRMAHEFFRISK